VLIEAEAHTRLSFALWALTAALVAVWVATAHRPLEHTVLKSTVLKSTVLKSIATMAVSVSCGGAFAALHARVEGPIPTGRTVLEGTVESTRTTDDGVSMVLEVARVEDRPARFRVSLFAPLGSPVTPGERVAVEAKLRPITPVSNPGEWSAFQRSLMRAQPVSGTYEANRLVRLKPAPAPQRWLEQTRGALELATRHAAPSEAAAALFLTLSAGLRATLDEKVEASFARSGLAHILSVSGLHVAALAFVLFEMARRLATRVPGRLFRRIDPRSVAGPLSLPLVWAYVAFTGGQPPAIRSALMCSVVLASYALRRRPHAVNTLCCAAAMMIAVDPSSLFDLSLQLSFLSVGALVLLTPALRGLIPVPVPSRKIATGWRLLLWRGGELILMTMVATIAVTAVTAPLVTSAFQRFGLSGLISNVIALPVSGLLTLFAAGSAAVFIVTPGGAFPLLWLGTRLAGVLLQVADLCSTLPGSNFELPGPSLSLTLLWWLGLASFALTSGRMRFLGCVAPLALLIHLRPFGVDGGDRLEVTFLAVGHGDATVLSTRGRHVLVDGGGVPNGQDTGARFVLPFLRHKRIRTLDLAVLTHAHPDHALGLISTLEEVPTKRLWLSPSPEGPLTNDLIAVAEDADIEQVDSTREVLHLGDVSLEVVGPSAALDVDDESLHENDRSVVLLVRHHDVSFLLTGDVEAVAESHLEHLGPVTVMKAPHHGSDTSSSEPFVRATRPQHVVFCVGLNNRFQFPRGEVVRRYESMGARCYRTDRDGAVTFTSDGRSVEVETLAPARRRATSSVLDGALKQAGDG
jgi:competence protein ComEC